MELNDLVSEQLTVTLYGDPVKGFEIRHPLGEVVSQPGKDILLPVRVAGIKTFGACVILPSPILLLLPGAGQELKVPECGWEKPKQKWSLDPKFTTAAINITPVAIGDLAKLRPSLDVQADFHLHDVHLDGTTIRGKLRSYLHLHQSLPFPLPDINVTVVDRDDAFAINLAPGTCITVFSIGVASAQVCYRANPNRICGEVQVGIDLPVIGHWGQNFTIACVNF
jgi:hypothetical protein